MKSLSRPGRLLAAVGATTALLVGMVVAVPTAAQAVVEDVGLRGPTYDVTTGFLPTDQNPTGTKTQHKVWYAGGSWWASMARETGTGFSIHKLTGRDSGVPTWVDTNILIDSRDGTSSDALYNASANKLFIATHVVVPRNTVIDAQPANLMRYSLVDGVWVLDEGFPILVVNLALTSLAIAQMTDGKIMATWVSNRRPYAANTTTSASGVSAPTFTGGFVIQWTKNTLEQPNVLGATTLTNEDVSAITAADGFVTIVFSNQNPGFEGFFMARHRVADVYGTGNFFGSKITSGTLAADSSVALVTDPQGGATSPVYAVIKSSRESTVLSDGVTPRDPNPADARLRVLKIQPRSGGGALTANNAGYVDVEASATITTVAERGARPTISLDNTRRAVDVFYSAPSDVSVPGASGIVYRKSVPLTGDFVASDATVTLSDAQSSGILPNKPDGLTDTSVGAQIVNAAMGTVVIATNTEIADPDADPLVSTRSYWWNDLYRSTSAAFTAQIPITPENVDGLTVEFADTSLGRPTSWAWDFGDGASSTQQNPSHTYATPGSKTVSLTVTNFWGSETTVSKTQAVGQAPVPRFTGKQPTKHLLALDLTDTSTGLPDKVVWNFGDGTSRTVNTPGATVRHPYAKSGKYKVTLTAYNGAAPDGVSVDHPSTVSTTYYFIVHATPSKIAKPTRTALSGRKAVVTWAAPRPNGQLITKYWVVCRAKVGLLTSVRQTVVAAKDGNANAGRARSATVTSLSPGRSYSCTVKAYNAKGWNLPSAPSTAFVARA